MKKSVYTAALLATALFANPYQNSQEELDSVKAIGQKTSAALLKTLGSNLKKHFTAGGPMEALTFCNTNAMALTQSVDKSAGEDISVKRISLKYRNPANAPEADEKQVLESLQAMQENGVVLPEEIVEKVGKDTYKYYKPLLINKGICLSCHGDLSKTPEVADAIHKLYPEDKAVGYQMNDLRGAVVVTVHK